MSAGGETVTGTTTIIGYARVSTTGQDLDAQLAALDAAGVESGRVFTDKLSGSAKTARPGLAAMLDYARTGDTVVVTAIDRLDAPSRKSPELSLILVKDEYCCAPYAKGSTPPPRPGGLWQP